MNENKVGFFKNHLDTIAIIGVNLAIATILVTMMISSSHRIDAANARSDQIMFAFHQEMSSLRSEFHQSMDLFRKEFHQETKDFHGRLCVIEEKKMGNR